MALYSDSVISRIIRDHDHDHQDCLRRKVKDNTLINLYLQQDPRASGLTRSHSLPILKISAKRPSIVDRLAARSVTEQSLEIRVHQHIGYRVHFVWVGGRSMERRFFTCSDAVTFCIELCKYGLEVLCSCLYGAYHSYIPGKAHYCSLGTFYPFTNIINTQSGG
jgi:hypothetical protein